MLSGEVGFFKGTMQLTHPAFLILDGVGSGQGQQVAGQDRRVVERIEDDLLAAFERDFFPIYPASAKVQSWDIYACVRQVLAVLDPIDGSAAGNDSAAMESDAPRTRRCAPSISPRTRTNATAPGTG